MRTLERQVEMDELLGAGINPLEYMLRTVRDGRLDPAMRLDPRGPPRRTIIRGCVGGLSQQWRWRPARHRNREVRPRQTRRGQIGPSLAS
jgi:hypothetical protein